MSDEFDDLGGVLPLTSSLSTFQDDDSGTIKISSPEISSTNFDGGIPRVLYTDKYAKDILIGDYVYLNSDATAIAAGTPTDSETLCLIKNVSFDDDVSTTVYLEYIYNNEDKSLTVTSADTTLVTLVREDWTNKEIGTTGWIITSGGNAIFTNVAVRGAVEASSGKIGTDTDYWYIGNSTYESPSHGTIQSFPLSQDVPSTANGIELDASGYIDIYTQYGATSSYYKTKLGSQTGFSTHLATSAGDGTVATSIPPSGNIEFRGIKSDNTLSSGKIRIESTNTDIGSLADNGTFAIYTGLSTTTWAKMAFDSNEIQTSSSTNSGSTWTTNTLSINANGSNINLGNSSAVVTISGTATIGSLNATAASSTTKVTNLNADLLDGLSSGAFLRSDTTDTWTGTTLTFTPNSSTQSFVISKDGSDPRLASDIGNNLWGKIGGSDRRIFYSYLNTVNYLTLTNGSDRRIKNSISDLNLGLEFLNKLRPVSFLLNEGGKRVLDENGNVLENMSSGTRTHLGLIAQEVKEVIDEYNLDLSLWGLEDINDADSTQLLSYIELVSPLIKAVQELSLKINSLEERLAILEN